MKNSWISFGASKAARLLLIVLLALTTALGAKKKQEWEDLTNFNLGPEYAQWLIGAVALLATPEEIEEYLVLSDDSEAESFIEEFWARRTDPDRPWPQRQLRDLFEQRAEEADRLFTEAAILGRRTDRGQIHVLYGPPVETSFEIEEGRRRQRPVEVWVYDKGSGPGLDGSRPELRYYFVKSRGVTERYFPRRPLSRFGQSSSVFSQEAGNA